jgi:carbon storage regulator
MPQTSDTTHLVITRRRGETVRIGPDITVEVVQIRGRAARIAITAPRAITILRTELETPEHERKAS